MLRRALPILAALLLVALPTFAADPGARPALAFSGAVNDVALAWGTGALGVATQDPGSRTAVPPTPTTPSWFLYSPDGRNLLQDGGVDPAACDGFTLDDCQTHATLVALDQAGERMAAAGVWDTDSSIVVLVRDSSGQIARFELAGLVQDLAMSDNGQTVVAVTSMAQGTGSIGRVYLYDWPSGSGTPVLKWSDLDLPAGATDVALAPDGQSVAVAAGTDHYRYRRATNVPVADLDFTGTAVEVAIANGGQHLSVGGSSDGYFILYNDQTTANQRELRVRDVQSSLDSVAIRSDGSAIALGNAAGDVWVYRIDPVLMTVSSLVGKVAAGGAVKEVAFARDGNSIAVAAGNNVAHYAVESNGLVLLWSVSLTTPAGDVSIDEHADRVATGNASAVLVYQAVHRLDVIRPSIPAATPGQMQSVLVGFKNAGNRMESATVAVTPPSGWAADIDKTSFRLAPDGTATVRVNVTVPAGAAPGTRQVVLTHNAGAAGSASTNLAFTVGTVERTTLSAFGPNSLSLQAGGSNVFQVNVTNEGNVAKDPAVTVAAQPAGWTAKVAGETGVLAPGGSRLLAVTLTAPEGAAQLAQGTATVSSPGALGSPVVLTGTVGASFNVDLQGPATVPFDPSGTMRVDLQVRNAGNAPDSIEVHVGTLPTGWTVTFLDGAAAQRVSLLPGQAVAVPFDLHMPEGTDLETALELSVIGASVGDPARGDTFTFRVTPPGTDSSETSSSSHSTKGKGSPGPAPLLLAAALVAAAFVARRRMR